MALVTVCGDYLTHPLPVPMEVLISMSWLFSPLPGVGWGDDQQLSQQF